MVKPLGRAEEQPPALVKSERASLRWLAYFCRVRLSEPWKDRGTYCSAEQQCAEGEEGEDLTLEYADIMGPWIGSRLNEPNLYPDIARCVEGVELKYEFAGWDSIECPWNVTIAFIKAARSFDVLFPISVCPYEMEIGCGKRSVSYLRPVSSLY